MAATVGICPEEVPAMQEQAIRAMRRLRITSELRGRAMQVVLWCSREARDTEAIPTLREMWQADHEARPRVLRPTLLWARNACAANAPTRARRSVVSGQTEARARSRSVVPRLRANIPRLT